MYIELHMTGLRLIVSKLRDEVISFQSTISANQFGDDIYGWLLPTPFRSDLPQITGVNPGLLCQCLAGVCIEAFVKVIELHGTNVSAALSNQSIAPR